MANFLEIIFRVFDRHVTKEDVRNFLLKEFESFNNILAENDPGYDDLKRLREHLSILGWISDDSSLGPSELNSTEVLSIYAMWKDKLHNAHVISKGIVETGAGRNLDLLDHSCDLPEFVRAEAIRLLRHVETRRFKALKVFSSDLDAVQIFQERAEISIFFSRYARRHGDLRYINAVLKLNEWLMSDFRKAKNIETRVKFLLSLAEQEISAREIMA